jgi:hypothetical protein
MLLLECMRCGYEIGCGEYGTIKKWHSAAYARSFIEDSPHGHLRKSDR